MDVNSILKKLGIEKLNEMQVESQKVILSHDEIVLMSPTGTGKTLAFLLPIIIGLDVESDQIQAMIVVPSRELAMQIEQVAREMGSGFKINSVYGGRSGYKDKMDLKHPPAILIGTPGRIADHIRRENIHTNGIKTLVLDEFDKSLEVGFEKEMREIVNALPSLNKKVLTSATQKVAIPDFIGIKKAKRLTFSNEEENVLDIKMVMSPTKDKLETLLKLLGYIGEGNGIVFCNLKDTIEVVSNYLQEKNIGHACFYGGLEQMDRERSLIKFRNGTHRLLIATDLAARGIDVPEMDFIIHLQLPFKRNEFVHRNGRTARMHNDGRAFIIHYEKDREPDYVDGIGRLDVRKTVSPMPAKWKTLHITGGRKDKISKGDIAGLFFKKGGLEKGELGIIELQQDSSYVAVPRLKANKLVKELNNERLKKKKVRISLLD